MKRPSISRAGPSPWPAAVASLALALGVHVGAVLLLRGRPLVGTSDLASAVASLAGRPEIARVSAPEPLRVALGAGEWVPIEGPGPRAALDPSARRRPPELGPALDDLPARMQATGALFSPRPEEAADGELLQDAPRSGQKDREGSGRTWADIDLSLQTALFDSKTSVAKLPARFLAPASLERAAALSRPRLDGVDEARRLLLPSGAPAGTLELPPDPDRPLRVSEVFVDILSQ